MSEDGWHDVGTLVAQFPASITRGGGVQRFTFAVPPGSGQFTVSFPLEPVWTPRRIARLFGVSLLDLDPAFAREVRSAHVEYDRRRRARRRRRRA